MVTVAKLSQIKSGEIKGVKIAGTLSEMSLLNISQGHIFGGWLKGVELR